MINQDLISSKWFDYQTRSVSDKAIVVTGGTTGIGRATAMLLAAEGARVLIVGREKQALETALSEMRQANPDNRVSGINADLANYEDVQRLFRRADEQFGELDVLVNNAAVGYKSIMDGGYQDWQYVVRTNLLGSMACSHEAIERMKQRGEGHIVNIGSMSADVREKGSSVYVATKSGIEGFSEALRKEVNPMGIKVSLIEPGEVGSDMNPKSAVEERKAEENLALLKAEDIAASVLYVLTQPKRCDVVVVQVRPHLQSI